MKAHHKIITAGIAALGLIGIANTFSNSQPAPVETVASPTVYVKESLQPIKPTPAVRTSISPTIIRITPTPTPTQAPVTEPLSNNNYYVNSDGSSVHSPAYSNAVPAGASAQCRDGSYSFSQHARGTCSHHGGVAEWL